MRFDFIKIALATYTVVEKMHRFYFRNNSVKQCSIEEISGMQIPK